MGRKCVDTDSDRTHRATSPRKVACGARSRETPWEMFACFKLLARSREVCVKKKKEKALEPRRSETGSPG